MNPDPNPAKAIFLEAVERHPPDGWPAFLDRACAGRPELRGQVEDLLEAHREVGTARHRGFADGADTGPAATFDLPPAVGDPGTVIGPYKLVELIGEGGMGSVWMAQQAVPVKRLVAVKLIKAGMDSRQVIARFEAERQALALMDHPNIARVLDAGTTDAGRPYFVMDLVKGMPITRYCDEHRLTPRERLELFLPVCLAVQHAHQKGIIHRDIKPSNVLVALYDGRPVPKVIDFGVAKAAGQPLTEQTLVTGFGAIVGTLEYMSPEQAEINQLDIDTRSDIYSLGALLYELLTGSTPFSRKELEKAGLLEMLRVIREQEPSRPSTKLSTADGLRTLAANRGTEPTKLSRLVCGELDWIVMKALEKDRNRRYETANGFALDVQRYLADEPVLACPPSAAYRLRKFVRRNRASLMTSAVMTLAVLLVAVSLGWTVRDRAARKEEINRDRAEQRMRIEASALGALNASDEHLQRGDWQQSLVEARRAESLLASGPAGGDLHRRVAERLADLRMVMRLDELRTAVPENPVAWDAAAANEAYTRLFREYGVDLEEPGAEAAGRQLRGRAIHVQLALALDNWARRVGAGRRGRLLAIARAADPDELRCRVRDAMEHRDRVRLLELAQDPGFAQRPAATVALLAYGLLEVRETDAAVQLLRQGQNHHRDDFRINFLLAQLHLYNQRPARPDDAIRFYQAALAIQPKSPGVLNNLADALTAEGQLDEAIELFRESIALQPDWWPAHANLASALVARGDLDEAARSYAKIIELRPGVKDFLPAALAAFRRALGRHPGNPDVHCNLGIGLHAEGNLDEAVVCFRNALELDPKHIQARLNLAHALRDQGKIEEAATQYDEAFRLDPGAAGAPAKRARLYARLGRFREAADHYGRAVEGESADNSDWCLLAALHAYLGEVDAYHDVCVRALARFERSGGRYADERVSRACLLLPTPAGLDPARAAAMAHRALAADPLSPWNQLAAAMAEYRLGSGHYEQAVRLIDTARPHIGDPQAALALDLLRGMALHRLGHTDEARVRFAVAAGRADRNLARAGAADLDTQGWVDSWLLAQVLRREAEGLIGPFTPEELASLHPQAVDRELADLSRAVEQSPDGLHALGTRAQRLLEHGRFAEADADYTRLMELHSTDPWHWYFRACLLAYLGRERDYREHRRAMLEQFASSQDKNELDRITKAALLLPGVDDDEARRLLERARRVRQTDANERYFDLLVGMAEYRAGAPEAAVPWLERCRSTEAPARSAAADAFLAMAHRRLGRKEKAEAALERSRRLVEGDLPRAGVDDLNEVGAENWLIAHTTLREAASLLRADVATRPASPADHTDLGSTSSQQRDLPAGIAPHRGIDLKTEDATGPMPEDEDPRRSRIETEEALQEKPGPGRSEEEPG